MATDGSSEVGRRTAPDAYARKWLLQALADAFADEDDTAWFAGAMYAARESDLLDLSLHGAGRQAGRRAERDHILARDGRQHTTTADQRDRRDRRKRERQARKRSRAKR